MRAIASAARQSQQRVRPMETFFYLIPISLLLGLGGLMVFFWSYDDGQYEDLDGAAERILEDDDDDDYRIQS